MNRIKRSSCLILISAAALSAAELQPVTVASWAEYVQRADQRNAARLDGREPFLWIDQSPEKKQRVRAGEIVVSPVERRGTQGVPGGLIHDWIGAAFIPNATLEGLVRVLHDYSDYPRFYKPVVVRSELLACTPARQEFSMVWQRKVLFVNFAMQGRYEAHDIDAGPHRGASIADATEVREFQDYGRADEHLLPSDKGNGFVWRLRSVARFEERDGGVYLELEAIALTRDIPASLRWLVGPTVNRLSVNSLSATLRQTREAVRALPPDARPVAACWERGRAAATTTRRGDE